MNKERKNFIIGLFLTLTIFGLFVFLFIEPKYGPQLVYNSPQTNNEETISEEDVEELLDIEEPTENSGNNPDYGELTDEQISIADRAIGNLLNSTEGITPPMITVQSIEQREFNDASLGCPQGDMMYAQVVTPGYQVVLEANGETYDYRISEEGDNVVLCTQ